jgi:hypothetical protein
MQRSTVTRFVRPTIAESLDELTILGAHSAQARARS